jgi:hypothetical protein
VKRRQLTAANENAIAVSLRLHYQESMNNLDLAGSDIAGHFLREAGNAWDAYRAFMGYPMHNTGESR